MVRFFELRGTGKSFRLMQMAYAQDGIFVSHDAKPAMKMAEEWGFDPKKITFMSFYDFIYGGCRGCDKPVFIDEAEYMLQYMAQGHLKGYSIGMENNEQYWPYLQPDAEKYIKWTKESRAE